MINICTIGDSHSFHGWKDICIPEVVLKWSYLGPKLMYSFNENSIDITSIPLKAKDAVVFCFGEIDVRCHVHNHSVKSDFHKVIDDLIKKYFNTISAYAKIINNKDVKICVYFVPPVSKNVPVNEDSNYPFIGTDEERKSYSIYINERLRAEGKQYGFIFIDLYDAYCDEFGFLDPQKSIDYVHIADSRPLSDFIKKDILERV